MGAMSLTKRSAMRLWRSPYRFFAAAAILAAIFTLLPMYADAPPDTGMTASSGGEGQAQHSGPAVGVPADADLSARTQHGAYLHSTLRYLCGHSVQRREPLPAALAGLTRSALEAQANTELPDARITGFSAQEVDVTRELGIPCPLHWVLRQGEGGTLEVLQNTTGEALSVVRSTEIAWSSLSPQAQDELREGKVFDDVQALEGYMESLSS